MEYFKKYNRFLAELSMIRGRSLNKPWEICCRMTMQCNSRCCHCDVWKKEYHEDLTTEQWIRFLSSLHNWLGNENIVFTGGEALLRPDMIYILNYAIRRGFRVELLSNGIIFDDVLAKKIAEIGLRQITFSYDGISAETHDSLRGVPGNFASTVSAVMNLNYYRKQFDSDFAILLKTVVNETNVNQLYNIAQWAASNGARSYFQPIEQNYYDIKNQGVSWYKSSPLWVSDLHSLKIEIEKLKQFLIPFGSVTNSLRDLDNIIAYFHNPEDLMQIIQEHDSDTPKKFCRHAVSRFDVSSNGDVRMCFRMDPIGNIKADLPQVIWDRRNQCWASRCNFR